MKKRGYRKVENEEERGYGKREWGGKERDKRRD